VDNIAHLGGNPNFKFIQQDVTEFIFLDRPVDYVWHFASPASPIDYLELPIQTLKVGSLGTHKALGLAKHKKARFLSPPPRKFTATRSSIRRPRNTGATSTPSARAAATTRPSASPRR
jgi:nucleoside-diphosphate-sugar epimerase